MISLVSAPQIGQWYERADASDVFQVTGIDERARTVEIQSLNGDIGEIDRDTWPVLALTYAQQPEEGVATLEESDTEDLIASRAEATLEDPGALARLA